MEWLKLRMVNLHNDVTYEGWGKANLGGVHVCGRGSGFCAFHTGSIQAKLVVSNNDSITRGNWTFEHCTC